jgi:hypothetical protein
MTFENGSESVSEMGIACSMHGKHHRCFISGRVIKMVLNKMGYKGVECIQRVKPWAGANNAKCHQAPYKMDNVLSRWVTISFLKTTNQNNWLIG